MKNLNIFISQISVPFFKIYYFFNRLCGRSTVPRHREGREQVRKENQTLQEGKEQLRNYRMSKTSRVEFTSEKN